MAAKALLEAWICCTCFSWSWTELLSPPTSESTPGHNGSIAKNCSKSPGSSLDLLHLEPPSHDRSIVEDGSKSALGGLDLPDILSFFPLQDCCHQRGQHHPMSRPIRRLEWQQKRNWRLGSAVQSVVDHPMSRRMHLPELQQKRSLRPGSAACSSTDRAPHDCRRQRQNDPRSPPIRHQKWQQTRPQKLGSPALSSADAAQHYYRHRGKRDPREQRIR